MTNRCRLQIEGGEVSLRGSAVGLRQLVSDLRRGLRPVEVQLDNGVISQAMTSSNRLRIALEGTVLTVEGDEPSLEGFYSFLTAVADQAEEPRSSGISAHAHLEYLGDGDEWRTPDSLPLLIQADEDR
jgi:hypothetical protein